LIAPLTQLSSLIPLSNASTAGATIVGATTVVLRAASAGPTKGALSKRQDEDPAQS